jgi:hypothetical protein
VAGFREQGDDPLGFIKKINQKGLEFRETLSVGFGSMLRLLNYLGENIRKTETM